MLDKFDTAFIDSLDMLQDVPNTPGDEMLEVGIPQKKSRETTQLDQQVP